MCIDGLINIFPFFVFDSEKSEKAKKREEKKAEKKAKKANIKSQKADESGVGKKEDGGADGAADTPDFAQDRYGELQMNQSREKPKGKDFINVGILGPKLNGQKVWVRARLHTSRATG